MATWRFKPVGGVETTFTRPDLEAASARAAELSGEDGYEYVLLIEPDPSEAPALAAGVAKLVNLGLTEEEALAIAGQPIEEA